MIKEEEYNTICIIMLGLFGDVLMRTPILRSIKKTYPKSKITVIVDPIGKTLLEKNPNIHKIIVINRKKNKIVKYLINKILIQLKIIKNRYDLIIDLYNGKSSKNMLKLSFSRYKLGLYSDKVFTNIKKVNKKYTFENKYHLTNILFEYLNYLNLDEKYFDTMPEYFFNDENNIRSIEKSKTKRYLISLGSGGLEKILELNKTYELINYIYHKYSMIPMIVSNPGQEFLQSDLINKYLKTNNIEYIKLDNKSINEMALLIKYSKFFIVPDTGLFHLSLALKTPTFCIFTYTNPILVQPKNMIYGSYFKSKEPFEYDKFGLKTGTKEVNMNEVFQEIDFFINQLFKNKI